MTHELRIKQQQFNHALSQSLGLSLFANVVASGGGRGRLLRRLPFGDPPAAPLADRRARREVQRQAVHIANQGVEPIEIAFRVTVISRRRHGWTSRPAHAQAGPKHQRAHSLPGDVRDQSFAVTVPAHRRAHQALLQPPDPRAVLLRHHRSPLSQPAHHTLSAGRRGHLHLRWRHRTLAGVVQTVHRYVGPGPVLEPLLVAPAISLTVSPHAGVVPVTNATLHLQVKVHSSVKGPAKGSVRLDLPAGWTSNPESAAPFATRERR